MFGFGKKKATERSVTWSPPAEDSRILDELKLCEACQFKGKCQFRSGCRSLKDLLTRKRAKLDAIRGYKDSGNGRIRLNYLYRLNWNGKLLNSWYARSVKIVHVDEARSSVDMEAVLEKDGKRESSLNLSFTIRLEFIKDANDRPVVDLRVLRETVARYLNSKIK